MGYLHAIKTDDGNALLSRVMAGETKIMFTKLTISDKTIDEYEIKQEIVASSEKFVDSGETGVVLTAVFRNTNMTEGYYIQTIGVYAKDDDGNEVMFSYLPADDNPHYLEADNGQVPQLINVRVESGIHLADDSVIVINPDGVATIEFVENKIQEVLDIVDENNTASTIPKRTADKYIKASTPKGFNNECLVNKGSLNSVTEVIVPYDSWLYNSTTHLYQRNIDVTNMYSSYVGTRDCKPRIQPGNFLETIKRIKKQFNLIEYIESNDGYITLYARAIPTNQGDVYANLVLLLYGV